MAGSVRTCPRTRSSASCTYGDNDAHQFPLTVPAGNANDEFARDRIWRNTGISQNSSTDIPDIVNWEWDAVPTQAQYLAQQPAGVKRLSASNVQTQSDNSWLQDEGRARNTTPPPGQPGTVNAVKYAAPSGALVFSSGTMQWSNGLSGTSDARIQQATYNVFSDMGIQPETPDGVQLDPGGSNHAPVASFTISANPAKTNVSITFNGSGSTDSDGTISKYEWDLDGDGDFEVSSTTNSSTSRSYSAEGTYTVRLRVTDSGGATDLAVKTLTIINNQPPTATAGATPNPVIVGQNLTLSGAGSADSDGTIVKYEWDADGNGTYEINAGASVTTTTSYATAGTRNVGLRVTDNGGKTATASVPVTVSAGGVSNYGDAVLDTPGLLNYWRMGEGAGSGATAFADSKGTSPATLFGGPALGATGAVAGDPNTAAHFDGNDDNARANLNLSGTNKVTVEFWLKTDFANDDRLAAELTASYHDFDGGFLIDPNAPQNGGTFAVGIGRNASRNTAYFQRPSSGQWHHYAIAMDTSAPAASQITPYIDGQPVTYAKLDSGTGAGNFANATLYLMSRAGTGLFGNGDLDEFAVYNRVLDAATIQEHYASYGTNRRPVAAFTLSPATPKPNQTVTFNGSSSSDPDGSIVKYEWDLDGNGSFETNTGTTPTATKSYAAEGDQTVRLRVTDNLTGTDVETKTFTVKNNQAPTAAYTATPNPVIVGQTVNFNGSGSSDPDGSIAKYEWDLDGNGTYELDTGTTATTSKTYTVPGSLAVGLRVTDNGGSVATKVATLQVRTGGLSSYPDAVQATPDLSNYWRLGETSGTTFADSKGQSPATAVNGVTMGVPGAVQDDPNAAARFDGSNDSASADVDLSDTSKLTVEFWLKWNAFAGDDRLAMEFTPNFNDQAGGFLIDPNAAQNGGTFGVGIGSQATRNNVFFTRPSANQWHHYALVFDTTAPGANQITPYVDGQPVTYGKVDSAPGSGNFANSTLYFMSRASSALFGPGDLDEVAIYKRALDAAAIQEHFESYGTNRRPVARLTATPNPVQPNQTVTFNASTSSDPDGSIVKYQWDLDGNGSYETDTGTTPTTTKSYANSGPVDVRVRVFDNANGTDTETTTVTVGNNLPTASFSATPNPAIAGVTVNFDASASSDPDGSIVKYEWDLDGNGSYETDTGTTKTTSRSYASTGDVNVGLRVTDDGGQQTTTTRSVQIVASQQPPTAAFGANPNPATTGQTVTFNGSGSNDPDGSIAKYEWDLDGNGSYETDTGASATTTSSYAAPGVVDVRLRVTDADGMTGTTTNSVYVNGSATTYSGKVAATGGLANYWRLGDTTGTTLADSKGSSPATISGGPSLGAAGGVSGDSDKSVSFDGVDDAASASLNLSGTSKLTLEFWLKWDAYANDDRLAMEFTPNFNNGTGGFLVDPNAPFAGGRFGVGVGDGLSRNTAYFVRPSAGQWHHYAIVLDTTATAANTITPYVDGQVVAFTKGETGVGAGPFANSQLFLMSRAASALFGAGDLDELAIYTRPLSPGEIADHYDVGKNKAPAASFTATPSSVGPGQTASFNAAASSDPDGSVTGYAWDLDGNGTYETNTGSTPTASRSYTTPGTVNVGLRVTDDGGATATTTRAVTVLSPPTASFTISSNPANPGQSTTFNGSGSTTPGTSITKYEWDLDGNGSYETDTGATSTASRSYATPGALTVGLRVTDNRGLSATTTRALTVQQPPTASFTVTPNPVVSGSAATFNGSGSTDPDGTVAKYEWDLDGNGSYETNTNATATTQKTYATPGTVTVGLRITDNNGATATTTRSVTVSNRAPTASFTVTPSPGATRSPVTFNGSGSTDPDGTIAKYEWDLDGNGSYEVDAGATASTPKTYTTIGTFTVGLRVTDNSGATATTTRQLVVNSAYAQAVLGTTGIRGYWRLADAGTTAADASTSGNTGTYVNGPTVVGALIAGEDNSAHDFDGSNDYVNLSASPFGSPSSVSAEAWVRTGSTKSSGNYHYLISDSSSDFNDGMTLAIDSGNRATFVVARDPLFGSVVRGQATSSVTLAPNTTHHVAGTYDGSRVRIYVDGVERGNVAFSSSITWSGSRDLLLGRKVFELEPGDQLPRRQPRRGRDLHHRPLRGDRHDALQRRQAVGRRTRNPRQRVASRIAADQPSTRWTASKQAS